MLIKMEDGQYRSKMVHVPNGKGADQTGRVTMTCGLRVPAEARDVYTGKVVGDRAICPGCK